MGVPPPLVSSTSTVWPPKIRFVFHILIELRKERPRLLGPGHSKSHKTKRQLQKTVSVVGYTHRRGKVAEPRKDAALKDLLCGASGLSLCSFAYVGPKGGCPLRFCPGWKAPAASFARSAAGPAAHSTRLSLATLPLLLILRLPAASVLLNPRRTQTTI